MDFFGSTRNRNRKLANVKCTTSVRTHTHIVKIAYKNDASKEEIKKIRPKWADYKKGGGGKKIQTNK